MADKTGIEWTDATWSPTLGCTRVSSGCDGCYAIRTVHRMAHNPNPKVEAAAVGLTAYRPGQGLDWTGAVRALPDRLDLPLHWRKPRRIFVDSQSDLFHDAVSDEFIARVFVVMAATPQHTYQILTKRHARMRALLSSPKFQVRAGMAAVDFMQEHHQPVGWSWPLPNVWLGVSVEDQHWAGVRIPALLDTPAAIRFLSCEPLLGPVDVTRWLHESVCPIKTDEVCTCLLDEVQEIRIDWVIVGGESGPRARPMHPDWARQLRDQCTAAGVPFHFKQWGEWGPAPWSVRITEPDGGWHGVDATWLAAEKRKAEAIGATHHIMSPDHLYEPDHKPWSLERDPDGDYPGAVRRWGKKIAGRELDGRTWDQYPEVVQ